MLDPQSLEIPDPPADVPEVQKLFAIRMRDVELLGAILPEFVALYRKDATGKLEDAYEPLRMAVQLYGEAYALHYWKARHILWWAAIESLYGNAEEAAMARIFAFFGNKSMIEGYHSSIYDPGDIPIAFRLRRVLTTRLAKWCPSSMKSVTLRPTGRTFRTPTSVLSNTRSEPS
jgi:hypothetical protein